MRRRLLAVVLAIGCSKTTTVVDDGFPYAHRTCWRDPKLGGCKDYDAKFRTLEDCEDYLFTTYQIRCLHGPPFDNAPLAEAVCWKTESIARGECNQI
jgi:hypothetical protein